MENSAVEEQDPVAEVAEEACEEQQKEQQKDCSSTTSCCSSLPRLACELFEPREWDEEDVGNKNDGDEEENDVASMLSRQQ